MQPICQCGHTKLRHRPPSWRPCITGPASMSGDTLEAAGLGKLGKSAAIFRVALDLEVSATQSSTGLTAPMASRPYAPSAIWPTRLDRRLDRAGRSVRITQLDRLAVSRLG